MLEELPDGDPVAVVAVAVDETGQVALDRRVERDLAFVDQLQDDRGGEGLGLAGDAEMLVRLKGTRGAGDRGAAGRQMPRPGRVARVDGRARSGVGLVAVEDSLGVGVGVGRGRRCGQRHSDGRARQDRDCPSQSAHEFSLSLEGFRSYRAWYRQTATATTISSSTPTSTRQ